MSAAPSRPWWSLRNPFAMWDRDRLLRERIKDARQLQGDSDELYDPIEDDPSLQAILAESSALAEAEVPDTGMGWCHSLWEAKQRILRNRYNVEWFSPADMNPEIIYD